MNTMFLAFVISQPPAVPTGGPPPVPTGPPAVPRAAELIQPPAKSVYDSALGSALAKNRPAIIFVGHKGAAIGRNFGRAVVTASVDSIAGVPEKCVLVAIPAKENGESYMHWEATLDAGATDADIRAAIEGRQVQAMPLPFLQESSNGPQVTADDKGPWLPVREQERIKKLLPKAIPGNPMFYSIPRLYQKAYTVSRQPVVELRGPDIDWPHDLIHSGGLEKVHGWKSYKGLDLPAKILTWKEYTDVAAYALVPMQRWLFPIGTRAYDVLVNDKDEVFEARVQLLGDDGDWQTKIFKGEGEPPAGYNKDLMPACASCHNRTRQSLQGKTGNKIYRHIVWGDHQRFSWHPWNASGSIDWRWPIESK